MQPSKDDILFTPCPTKYEIKDLSIKSPTWTISKAPRKKIPKRQGSFNYEYKSFIGEGPKYSFRPKYDEDGITDGKRIRGAPKKTMVPGPGFYDIKDSKTSPTYSFGIKHYPKFIKHLFRLNVPGVGAYNLRKEKDLEVPCFRMGKEERKNLTINETALKYNNSASKLRLDIDEVNSTTTPKWTLYSNERFSTKPKSAYLKRLNVPGPGMYTLQTYMGEGPKFSFPKQKHNHSDEEDEYISKKTKGYPSPTTYYKNNNYSPSGPFISMSKLKRVEAGSDKFLNTTPGPTYYNPDKKYLSTWTIFPEWNWHHPIQKSKSNSSDKDKITPGPGEYNYTKEIGLGPKYTFGKKLKKRKKDDFPGPGSYNIKTVIFDGPKYTMRAKETEKEIDKNIKDNKQAKFEVYSEKENKGFTFPKAKYIKKIKFIVPGPGAYRIPTSFDYISNMTREKGMFDPTFRYI